MRTWMKMLGVMLLLARVAPAAVPAFAPVQGYLTDAAGTPLDAIVSIRFALYDSAAGTTELWAETQSVRVVVGRFSVSLGQSTALPLTLFRDTPATWLGITVGADAEMTPRLPMQSVPYSAHAAFADDAASLNGLGSGDFARASPGTGLRAANGGLAIDAAVTQVRVAGTCAVGSAVRAIAADGTVTCETTTAASYTASNGITLSGRNFAADTSVLQSRVTGACQPGSAIMSIAANGAVSCQSVLSVASPTGAGATDVCLKAGTSLADGSVSASAKLFSLRTGLGGTEVEKLSVLKDGTVNAGGVGFGAYVYNRFDGFMFELSTARLGMFNQQGSAFLGINLGNGLASSSGTFQSGGELRVGGGSSFGILRANGQLDQAGTDSSATPGAATINKPTGISAIAAGATSVVITNNLVTPTSRVMLTWHGDHGAARWWVTRGNGSFTVTLSSGATANTAFSWTVASLL